MGRPTLAPRPGLRALALAVLMAGAVAQAQDEVPFITTPDRVTLAMLDLAGVGPADHVIDLGSGDGRIVITAARRFGASGLGVELVPELVQRSRASAQAAGQAGRVAFREQDLFQTDLSQATVVTMYLLPEVNLQLRPRLLGLKPGTRIVSHDWDMGDWPPDRSLTLDVPEKAIGREKRSTVHLWRVPARVQGLWCGADGRRLQISQRFQAFSAVLMGANRPANTPADSPADAPADALSGPAPLKVFDGRIDGRRLQGQAAGAAPPVLHADESGLHWVDGLPPGTGPQRFVPAREGRCSG